MPIQVQIPVFPGPHWEVWSKLWNLELASVNVVGLNKVVVVGHLAYGLHTVGPQLWKAPAGGAHRAPSSGLRPGLGLAHWRLHSSRWKPQLALGPEVQCVTGSPDLKRDCWSVLAHVTASFRISDPQMPWEY